MACRHSLDRRPRSRPRRASRLVPVGERVDKDLIAALFNALGNGQGLATGFSLELLQARIHRLDLNGAETLGPQACAMLLHLVARWGESVVGIGELRLVTCNLACEQ